MNNTEKIEMKSGMMLIIDPCYIKDVKYGPERRFDGLRTYKVLHDYGDGEFFIKRDGVVLCDNSDGFVKGNAIIPVDSGRIWAMIADFGGIEVEIESGLSLQPYILLENSNGEFETMYA